MLTIDIPKVNAQESAENELAQYILDEIEAKTVAYFKYFTADQNNVRQRLAIGKSPLATGMVTIRGSFMNPVLMWCAQ